LGKNIIDNIFVLLGIALVGALILIGGYMIGSASAYTGKAEHDRQIECIEHGGHMDRLYNSGLVCQK
jgi:hypothetical protein